MKLIKYIIIAILLLSMSMMSVLDTETFIYKTKFRSIRAGKTSISITPSNEKTNIIKMKSHSTKFIDLVHKLRHNTTMLVNDNNYSLLTINKNIQQGRYFDYSNSTVDYNTSKIYYQKTDKDKPIAIPFKNDIYDPFALIFYLRKLNLKIGDILTFQTYSNKKIRTVNLHIAYKETIKTPLKKTPCLVIIPKSNNGKALLKHKGSMKIWISDDTEKLPIKIQETMKYGVLELLLESYEKK